MGFAAVNRRAFIAGAAFTAALAATPTIAKKNNHPLVVNALGGLWNPNGGPPGEDDIASYVLDPRALADARAANIGAINLTLGHVFGEGDAFADTIDDLAWWNEAARRNAGKVMLVRSARDIPEANAAGRVGLIFGFQNSEMFGGDAARARLFKDLGVRVVQLTYNLQSAAGAGALVPENTGLTEFGRTLVGALNDQRLLVDLSHAGEKSTMDALETSRAPIAITHTGCAALSPHPRNKTDAELRALADKGGVMGVYFMPYLTPGRQHMAADIVAHIEHAINVCGEDHVGIGTDGMATAIDDMPGFLKAHREDIARRAALGVGAPNEDPDIITVPPDLMGPTQFERLADMLSVNGHSDARIEKVMSGNFLRLFGEVWGG
ncbi:MAG: membrane dipeptidase [Parvularculaceae bacterium]